MTWYKVTVDGIDYIEEFVDIQITGRECEVASAILIADNKAGAFWTDTVDIFDSITIQLRAVTHATPQGGDLQTEFAGTIREVKPYASEGGFYTGLKCKGLGAALEETHCKDTFGYTSEQASLSTIEEILEDLVDNSINKSYSSANNTGYAITKTYIPTIDAGLSIPFINAPYQTCKSLTNLICALDTAYRDGATAGPHWFVDSLGNLRVKTIGAQQVDGGGGGGDWGIYYDGGADSTSAKLYEDEDFYEYTLTKASDQYANSVVLAFDLRKPPYDYWAADHNLWGSDGLDEKTNDAVDYVVGTNSLRIEYAVGQSELYFPKTGAMDWDITAWGSEYTIPRLNFYFKSEEPDATAHLWLFGGDAFDSGVNFPLSFFPFSDLTADEWHFVSIPVGPYWANDQNYTGKPWGAAVGGAVWTDIDGICFSGIEGIVSNAKTWIDDIYFSGKCIREAVDTSEVTSYNEHQHVILSRTPLDDTAIYSDDSGMAGQICYAELLRRVTPPRMFTCTVPFKSGLKPGEYFRLYAGKTSAGTYKLNGVDFRVLEYTHRCTQNMRPTTSLVMTDDLKNSFPMSGVDARAILNEYLLENNSKAMDMQGGEVDLLIPHLRKTY